MSTDVLGMYSKADFFFKFHFSFFQALLCCFKKPSMNATSVSRRTFLTFIFLSLSESYISFLIKVEYILISFIAERCLRLKWPGQLTHEQLHCCHVAAATNTTTTTAAAAAVGIAINTNLRKVISSKSIPYNKSAVLCVTDNMHIILGP